MPHATIADFDFEGRVAAEERRKELEQRNQAYIRSHPELQQTLHDILESVLIHKPADPMQFIQEHVKAHREKHAPASSGI